MIDLKIDETKLTDADLNIYNYIRVNPEKFLEMTISQFSEKVFCSITTISRFVKKNDFKNYQMFKNYISKSLYEKYDDDKNNPTTRYNDLQKKYSDSINLNKNINKLEIKKIVESISKREKIFIFGLGTSSIVAQYFSESLNKINFFSITTRDIHQSIQFVENSLSSDDLFIIISKDFSSRELIFLLTIAEKKQIEVFCLTANKKLAKRKLTNIILFNHIQQINRVLSFSSKIILFYIVDIILFDLIKKNKIKKNSNFFNMWKSKNQI